LRLYTLLVKPAARYAGKTFAWSNKDKRRERGEGKRDKRRDKKETRNKREKDKRKEVSAEERRKQRIER
jgi:hypothetical protein